MVTMINYYTVIIYTMRAMKLPILWCLIKFYLLTYLLTYLIKRTGSLPLSVLTKARAARTPFLISFDSSGSNIPQPLRVGPPANFASTIVSRPGAMVTVAPHKTRRQCATPGKPWSSEAPWGAAGAPDKMPPAGTPGVAPGILTNSLRVTEIVHPARLRKSIPRNPWPAIPATTNRWRTGSENISRGISTPPQTGTPSPVAVLKPARSGCSLGGDPQYCGPALQVLEDRGVDERVRTTCIQQKFQLQVPYPHHHVGATIPFEEYRHGIFPFQRTLPVPRRSAVPYSGVG